VGLRGSFCRVCVLRIDARDTEERQQIAKAGVTAVISLRRLRFAAIGRKESPIESEGLKTNWHKAGMVLVHTNCVVKREYVLSYAFSSPPLHYLRYREFRPLIFLWLPFYSMSPSSLFLTGLKLYMKVCNVVRHSTNRVISFIALCIL
jgi:hypothetical protein